MKTTRQVCLYGVMMLLMASSAMAAYKNIEANGVLLDMIQKIAGRDAPWNKNYNRKTREVTQFVNKMEDAIRDTSEAMQKMNELQLHAEIVDTGAANGKEGGSFKELGELVDSGETDQDGNPIMEEDFVKKYGDPSNMLKHERGVDQYGVFHGGYARVCKKLKFEKNYIMSIKCIDKTVMIPELLMTPPYWLPDDSSASQAGWDPKNSRKLLIKISAKYRAALAQRKNTRDLEKEVNGFAQILLSDSLLQNFNPQALVSRLLTKAGVVRISERLTMRPSAPQDGFFSKYAGLGSKASEAVLFWSDPMVVNGYHPIFGTALNKTELRGCKMVDMDGVVSRGFSVLVDQWNRLQPSGKQKQNPFKGYASKVMPGLIAMSQEGRLGANTDPTDEQLTEAMKLSKKLRMLPSQNMKAVKKISTRNIRFHYPVRMILAADDGVDIGIGNLDQYRSQDALTGAVELSKLDKEIYLDEMKMIRRRLKEIDALKKINRLGYEYTNQILLSYIQMSKEADQVSKEMIGKQEVSPLSKIDEDGTVQKTNQIMVPIASIPEITQLRKAIGLAMEKQRDVLSDLQHEYDDLKQKEWVILEHLNQTRKDAVLKLMNSASVYYQTIMMEEGGSAGENQSL